MKLFTPKKKSDENKKNDTDTPTSEANNKTTNTQVFVKNTDDQEKHTSTETLVSHESEPIQGKSLNDSDAIKRLIEIISNNNEKSIIPIINFETNSISYPDLKKIGHDEHDVSYLEKLSSDPIGVLENDVYERWIVCPQHPEELSINLRRYCPVCTSMDIERLQLIEHKVCGYIAEMEKYGVRSTSELQKCPNCKRQIRNIQKEIRTPGRWNKCNKCGKKFDNVILRMHCRKFNHDFEINEVETRRISCYKLKNQTNESFATINLLPTIRKKLESLGFSVEESATVKGKSGVEHQTSIFAQNNKNKTVAIFIKNSKDVIDDTIVNSVLVEVLDIAPTLTIFIGIPSISENAKTMANTHGINIATGNNFDQIITDVVGILSRDSSISNST